MTKADVKGSRSDLTEELYHWFVILWRLCFKSSGFGKHAPWNRDPWNTGRPGEHDMAIPGPPLPHTNRVYLAPALQLRDSVTNYMSIRTDAFVF